MDIAPRTQKFDGARLRSLRTDKGWSQAELGRRIGAHVTSISDWERGDNAPSGRHVVGLAREFAVPADRFFGDDDDKEAAQMVHPALALLGELMEQLGFVRDKQNVAA